MNRLHKATCSLLLSLSLFSSACNFTANYVLEARLEHPPDYVVVSTSKRLQLDCVKDFLSFKRSQGFQVQTLILDLDKPMSPRCLEVQERLSELSGELEAPEAYVLLLATPEELTMGPWKFEGLERPRLSDAPYFFGHPCPPEKEIAKETWELLLREDFVWNGGRIPYEDPELLAAIFESTKKYFSAGKGPRRGMLGAERFALPLDSSLILSQAKEALEDRGFEVDLYASDWPYDVELGYTRSGRSGWSLKEDFMRAWAEKSPLFIYTLSHGGSHSIGRYLIDPAVLARLSHKTKKGEKIDGSQYFGREDRCRVFRPGVPAVLFSSGCFSGSPRSPMLRALFRRGWMAGFAGFLDVSIPLPLVAALNSEVNVAKFGASGLPFSRVIRLIREVYVDQSVWDPFYHLLPYVRRSLMTNCLASVYYGDPSLSYDLREELGGPRVSSEDMARR